MAGDWIAWSKGFAKKTEVLQLAAAFNLTRQHAASSCMEIWEWFDDNTRDGHAPSVTRFVLDDIAGVPGFTEGMINIGWLTDDGENISVPKFDRWNSQTAKSRILGTKRKQRSRTTAGQTSRSSHAASVTKARPEVEVEKELTTCPTDTEIPSGRDRSSEKPKAVPPAEKSPRPKPAVKPKPPDKPADEPTPKTAKRTWAQERYDELLTVVPDITFARGMPLLNKCKKTYGEAVVEQVIVQMCQRGETVALKDIWAVFQARCKDLKTRPAVTRLGGPRDGSVSNEYRDDPDEIANHWEAQRGSTT